MADSERQVPKSHNDIKFYKGLPLPAIFKHDLLNSALEYEHQDGDVILCTFPKTGSTWMTNVLWQILHKVDVPSDVDVMKDRYSLVPFLERSEPEQLERLVQPRFYRTHFPINFLKVNPKAKYVYIFRKPEDTVVSFYHYLKASERINCDFDEFFNEFVSGKTVYGSYFDHLTAANSYKSSRNFLFVSYEELNKETRYQMLRISKFLGEEYHQQLLIKEGFFLNLLLEVTSFEYMKKHSVFTVVPDGHDSGTVELNLYRKGVSGEGEAVLNDSQKAILRKKVLDELKDSIFVSFWY